MPKSVVILTDFQNFFLTQLFENESINNKKKEIPLRFNKKFNKIIRIIVYIFII
jgi:hypothetical protein